jgi:RNA polymerase sigma-70 factor (ECF subfamily)
MRCLRAMNGGCALFPGDSSDLPLHETLAAKSAPRRPSGTSAMTPPDLHKLTEAVKRGDEAAFTRFHQLYALRLYQLLLGLAHGREADAGEVLQAVMIKLTTRFEVFEEEGRLWAWLCSVARHSYVDYYRAQKRDQRFVPLEVLGAGPAEAMQPEDRLSLALRAALEELPPEDRELLRAFYLDKRPLMELAEEARQSYKSLESRLTRLRRKAKEKLLAYLQNENAPRS